VKRSTDVAFHEELVACSQKEQISDLKLVTYEGTVHKLSTAAQSDEVNATIYAVVFLAHYLGLSCVLFQHLLQTCQVSR